MKFSASFIAFALCAVQLAYAAPAETKNALAQHGRCKDSTTYKTARDDAERIRAIADVAKHRLEALNAASARARADPNYVYVAHVSPYHLIAGAQKDWEAKDGAARTAEELAAAICRGEPDHDHGRRPDHHHGHGGRGGRGGDDDDDDDRRGRGRGPHHHGHGRGGRDDSPNRGRGRGGDRDDSPRRGRGRGGDRDDSPRRGRGGDRDRSPDHRGHRHGGGRDRSPVRPRCTEAGFAARAAADAALRRLEALRIASAKARADPNYVYGGFSPYHAIAGAEATHRAADEKAKGLGC
ncbi:hypothetical protein HGRIS_003061 [Hohenbuehelia grisea]|uniref:Uncharacterized protein n=1 Tax=Hohenbuehelia grisea TaxID=104357 RepID=A0ABR3JMC0_9AGAR